ncbi:MAG: ShlB/FhaC/HecB family hemolysin secretion/activation protein [Betaproteobacteria bacterium]|nr:ShlB/FhaC/HecB family hemolysin secretion/activation protein [Betaproteobacteria bacterium]
MMRQFESQQSEQQRLRQLEELQRSNRAPAGEVPAPPAVPQSAPEGEQCSQVTTVKVDGVHLVPEAALRATVSAWEGKCLGLAEINSVLKAITFLYVERGYVAARAYLPEQDLSGGVLGIAVDEGSLEGIRLNGQEASSGAIDSAFPGMVGKPVNLRDIEQGLDQMNRLPSNSATAALGAGVQPGGSLLDITNNPERRVRFSLGTDSLGATVSGKYQTRLDVRADNAMGFNDLWQLGYQRSSGRNPFYLNGSLPNSDTVNASMSVPYGYWIGGLDAVWSRYRSSVASQPVDIDTSGSSVIASPYVTRVIGRDQVSKTSLTVRLTWKDTKNDIMGTRIDVASRTLSVASLELNHSRQLWGGQATAGLAYHRGLAVLGAFNDSNAPEGSAKGQFSKVTASVGYTRPLGQGGAVPLFSTYVMGQWTPDRLFGTEQMSFGGYSSIRGVRDAMLFADKGALSRTELSVLLPAPSQHGAAQLLGRVEPYIGVDVGYAAAIEGDPMSSNGTMVSAAIGVRNRAGRVAFDLWYAKLLAKPSMPANSMTGGSLVQGRISISF